MNNPYLVFIFIIDYILIEKNIKILKNGIFWHLFWFQLKKIKHAKKYLGIAYGSGDITENFGQHSTRNRLLKQNDWPVSDWTSRISLLGGVSTGKGNEQMKRCEKWAAKWQEWPREIITNDTGQKQISWKHLREHTGKYVTNIHQKWTYIMKSPNFKPIIILAETFPHLCILDSCFYYCWKMLKNWKPK